MKSGHNAFQQQVKYCCWYNNHYRASVVPSGHRSFHWVQSSALRGWFWWCCMHAWAVNYISTLMMDDEVKIETSKSKVSTFSDRSITTVSCRHVPVFSDHGYFLLCVLYWTSVGWNDCKYNFFLSGKGLGIFQVSISYSQLFCSDTRCSERQQHKWEIISC